MNDPLSYIIWEYAVLIIAGGIFWEFMGVRKAIHLLTFSVKLSSKIYRYRGRWRDFLALWAGIAGAIHIGAFAPEPFFFYLTTLFISVGLHKLILTRLGIHVPTVNW